MDGGVVGGVHVCRACVCGLNIEVILAIVAQCWDGIVHVREVGVCEHGQVTLDDTGIGGRRELAIVVIDLVEIANVVMKIWARSASVSRHRVDELDTVERVSVSVVDDDERAGPKVDVEVVIMAVV